MTPTERLAWLAGVFEGEGSMTLYVGKSCHLRPRRDGTHCHQLQAYAYICNTDEVLVAAVRDIFNEHGIGHQLKLQPRGGEHRPCWYVTCAGGKRVAALLTLLLPYLVAKKARAELALEIIRYRQTARAGLRAQDWKHIEDDEWLRTRLAELSEMNPTRRLAVSDA